MKVAPLIHSRTYSCDFNPEFKVRPSDFLDGDIKWARKIVLEATTSIDSLRGERWMIADTIDNRWRIAGVVGFVKDICSHCNLSKDELISAEELFYDNKGRKTYAFIGVAISASDWDGKIDLTYDFLWKKFYNLVQPIWKRTYQKTITVGLEPYSSSSSTPSKPQIGVQRVGKKDIYESNPKTDYDLFRYYLVSKSISNFSFCSNILDITALKSCEFSTITTSFNLITRLKREPVHAMSQDSTKKVTPSSLDFVESTQIMEDSLDSQLADKESDSSKKKHFNPSMHCLMIFVIAILIFILLVAGHISKSKSLVNPSEVLIIVVSEIPSLATG